MGSVREELARLDQIFGPGYFDRGRLVITVARDVTGVMKVAHRLQARANELLGSTVEVIMEHVKHEAWLKFHESSAAVGLQKGPEVPECQVTHIPEGVRVHPYRREQLPTLEVLLLWEDFQSGAVRGHCLYTMVFPEVPSLEGLEDICSEIERYFVKRWLLLQVCLAPPVKGEFEEPDSGDQSTPSEDSPVGEGVNLVVLACHAFGSARDPSADGVADVRHCQPMKFWGATDAEGRAKICFQPAEINKIQVAETDQFYGLEVVLPKTSVRPLAEGPTSVTLRLTPKALATVTVHVFKMPRTLPKAEDTEGVIDWASEAREPLMKATVELIPFSKGGRSHHLGRGEGLGTFVTEGPGLPEGCFTLVAQCSGFEAEERAVMLLVGSNEFYIPLREEMGWTF